MARLLSADARSVALEVEILAGMTILSGTPTARYQQLEVTERGEVGIWQMTVGTVVDIESDEVFVVLDGAAEINIDNGEFVPLRPGAVVRLVAGDHVEWRVTEPLRKVYVQL